jgi:hypothetical protein
VKQDTPLFRKEAYWKARAEAAEARLAQIDAMLEEPLETFRRTPRGESFRLMRRLARGEEASE